MIKKLKSKGSAVLELALVLPLFLMLLFGIIEFSRVLMVKQVITNAAREGARAGAVNLDDAEALSDAQTITENYITASGIELGPADVTPSFVATGGSLGLQVIVDYDYESLITTWIPGVPDNLTLRSTAIMRRES